VEEQCTFKIYLGTFTVAKRKEKGGTITRRLDFSVYSVLKLNYSIERYRIEVEPGGCVNSLFSQNK
jgi:hypothetical protein